MGRNIASCIHALRRQLLVTIPSARGGTSVVPCTSFIGNRCSPWTSSFEQPNRSMQVLHTEQLSGHNGNPEIPGKSSILAELHSQLLWDVEKLPLQGKWLCGHYWCELDNGDGTVVPVMLFFALLLPHQHCHTVIVLLLLSCYQCHVIVDLSLLFICCFCEPISLDASDKWYEMIRMSSLQCHFMVAALTPSCVCCYHVVVVDNM